MEVICNRPYPQNNRHTIRPNEFGAIYNEFEDLLTGTQIDAKVTSSQQKESNEKEQKLNELNKNIELLKDNIITYLNEKQELSNNLSSYFLLLSKHFFIA